VDLLVDTDIHVEPYGKRHLIVIIVETFFENPDRLEERRSMGIIVLGGIVQTTVSTDRWKELVWRRTSVTSDDVMHVTMCAVMVIR
jgi:hypothetical protein